MTYSILVAWVAACPGAAAQALEDAARAPAAVELCYDEQRIPHLFADDDAGVFFGLGYQQVLDFPVATLGNLWSTSGRFAEVAGRSALRRDERVRLWEVDRLARRQACDPAQLDPDVRALFQAYVAGVNAGRRLWLDHPEWIERLLGQDGEELALQPVPSWLDPLYTREEPRARLRHLLEMPIELEHVLAFGITFNAGPELAGGGSSAATNVFLVRNDERARSVLALIDSHQPIECHGFRSYFVQMSGPTYDVAGLTMPGIPCVLVGFNRRLAFQFTSLQRGPPEIRRRNLPFRLSDDAPAVTGSWSARLEPAEPLRFAFGETALALDVERDTLRYWDATSGELRDDPRGVLAWRRVPADVPELAERGLRFPVTRPAPDEPLAPGGELRFEGRAFLAERNAFEFWTRVGLCNDVGDGPTGTDAVFRRSACSLGQGGLVSAVDVAGSLEYVLSVRVPIPGARVQADRTWQDGGTWSGSDPAAWWQGFHPAEDLPRLASGAGFGEHVTAWVNCNASPHFVAEPPAFDPATCAAHPWVYEGKPWKSWRQDRARERIAEASADGSVTLDELTRVALDVQDSWSRAYWPLFSTVASDAASPVSARARAFAAWIDALRFEGPDGRPGATEFLAHPLSQVTPWMVLLRQTYLALLLELDEPTAAELGLGFDPVERIPAREQLLAAREHERNRSALREALERIAELRSTGLSNRALTAQLHEEWSANGPGDVDPWKDALWRRAAPGWTSAAGAVELRWGEVNFLALTPHRRPFPVAPSSAAWDRWLWSMLAPGRASASPFHARQEPLLIPAPGTESTLFQARATDLENALRAVQRRGDQSLFLNPVDFGSQALLAVELCATRAPRARLLALLGSTEILATLPNGGDGRALRARWARRFEEQAWVDLELDRARLAECPEATWLVLERPQEPVAPASAGAPARDSR